MEMPEPSFEKPRPRCPFYGFAMNITRGVLQDTGGNQCALNKMVASPCLMEWRGQVPDWEECPENDHDIQPLITEMRQCPVVVFPDEFSQPGRGGIYFTQWYDYVMGDQCPRPESPSSQ